MGRVEEWRGCVGREEGRDEGALGWSRRRGYRRGARVRLWRREERVRLCEEGGRDEVVVGGCMGTF